MTVNVREFIHPRSGLRGQIIGSLAFTGITVASAQIAIPLGFTPVPITFQVLAVLLSGLTLGSRWGAISQMQYLALGALGLPVFAGLSGGPAAFFGPSAGYLIGFVPGAFIVGWVFERMGERSRFGAWVAGIAGVCAIYLCGASWLAVWLSMFSSKGLTMHTVWALGIAPFIGIDLLKAIAASGLAVGGRASRGLIRSFGTLDR